MRTARPAARAPYPFFELRAQPFDMLPPCLIFPDGDCPADPLVSRKGRYVVPGRQCLHVGRERLSEISREIMYDSSGDLNCCHRTSRRLKDQASATRVQLGFRTIIAHSDRTAFWRDYFGFAGQPHTTGDIALWVPKTGDLEQRERLGNGDNDFAANMAGLDMANSFCDFAQRVGAVNNGNHGSSLD